MIKISAILPKLVSLLGKLVQKYTWLMIWKIRIVQIKHLDSSVVFLTRDLSKFEWLKAGFHHHILPHSFPLRNFLARKKV